MTDLDGRINLLDRSWSQAEQVLELAPVAFVVTDGRGMIHDANPAAGALLGIDRRQLRFSKPLSLFVADGRAFRHLLAQLGGQSLPERVQREMIVVARGGQRRHVAATARSFRDEGGVLSILWGLVDIEPRVAAETELRVLAEELEGRVAERTAELETERARLAAILDEMPAGVIVASAPAGEIVITNDQAEEMLGGAITAAEVVNYGQVAGFDEAGRRLEPQDWPLGRALVHGESIRDERIRVERDDGSFLTIEANANPIRDGSGRIAAAVVVFWDVSERERRERAEREFITNAAHELQTPVASIVSAVEVLIGGAKDDPEDRERFLGHLERESGRLVRILRSLLLIARTQLAGESVELAPVQLRPLLDAVALALRPRRGIEVVVRCPVRLTARSNEELLEQAVGNLAANSARHTVSGRITLSASRRAEGIRIEVADTGPGIDPAEI